MEQGFVRIEDDGERAEWMPILKAVYEYESKKISGAHGGTRRLSEYAWTLEAMLKHLHKSLPTRALADLVTSTLSLLDYLRSNRQLLSLDIGEGQLDESQPDWRIESSTEDLPDLDLGEHPASLGENGLVRVHASRMAELVRTSGNVREYKRKDNQSRRTMIESTSWTPVLRPSLNRNIDPDEVAQELAALRPPNTMLKNHPTVSLAQALEDLRTVLGALESGHAIGPGYKISAFQKQGMVESLKQSWFGPSTNPNASGGVVIAAGTGFGKTLAFAVPVLTDALIQTREDVRRCSQVLLYPRNDLAIDQTNELKKYIRAINDRLHAAGETDRNFGLRMDAATKIKEREDSMPGNHLDWGIGGGNVYSGAGEAYAGSGGTLAASIVVASVESFRRRLTIPDVIQGLGLSLKRVVIDEIHLNSGIQGAHLQRIMQRVRQAVWRRNNGDDTLHVVGASATIASPEHHLESISHLKRKHILLVEALPDNGAPLGIMNHVLYQPRSGRSMIGSVVDISSALTHQRRGDLGGVEFADRPTSVKAIQKTIGFSDGHEIVGTWWSNFVRNEMTEEGRTAAKPNPENPYPHWHYQPLRCQDDGTTKGSDVCGACTSGNLSPDSIEVPEQQLWKFVHKPDGSLGSWSSPLDVPSDHQHSISGLGTCPHLEYGTCWWFVERDDIDLLETITAQEFKKNVVRAFRHTSKTRGEVSSAAGADQAYRKSGYSTAYAGLNVTAQLPHDFAIATPTLEVGIDMSNVTEVLTHKAIRNVSSYRQKIGRAGREQGTDAVAMTVLARNSTDTNHLRSPRRLVAEPIADPVPVATENEDVLANQAYEAAWDYLAIRGHSIELIPQVPIGDAPGRAALIACFNTARTELLSGPCVTYIENAVYCETATARNAATQAAEHVALFLLPHTRAGAQGAHPTFIEWLAAKRANSTYPNIPDPNHPLWAAMEALRPNVESLLPPSVVDDWNQHDWLGLKTWAAGCTPTNPHVVGFHALCGALVNGLDRRHQLVESLDSLWRRYGHTVGIYFSSVLRTVFPEVNELNQNVPYASLEALFTNPSESTVQVVQHVNGDFESEAVPTKEAMAFMLPGMWTHRLPGGKRLFANHGKDLVKSTSNDDIYMMRFDLPTNIRRAGAKRNSTLGPLAYQIPSLLPLGVSDSTEQYRLEFIGMSRDNGASNRQAMIKQGQVDDDARFWAWEATPSPGINRTMKRPDTYAVSWILAEEPEDCNTVGTFVASPQFKPLPNHAAPLDLSANQHPLLHHTGITVGLEQEASIKRLALGVTRANGVWLQPSMNEEAIVWTDDITTPALRFTIPPSSIHRLLDHYCNPNRPFDETVLQIFGHHFVGELNWSAFDIEPFLNCLLAVIYSNPTGDKNLPADLTEALNRLFGQGREPTLEIRKAIAEHHLPEEEDDTAKLAATLLELWDKLEETKCWLDFPQLAEKWVRTNAGNGLGMLLKELVAEMSGVPASSVGYTYSFDQEQGLMVTVFDDDAQGNGSINLAAKYFHMPRESREITAHLSPRTLLPNVSLLDLLEHRLQPCSNHLASTVAINDSDTGRLPMLENTINDLKRRHQESWQAANVASTREANLLRRIVSLVSDETDIDVSKLEAAFDVCDSGCHACQSDSTSNLFSPFLSPYTQHKELLERLLLGEPTALPVGYKLEIAERHDILAEAGQNIGAHRIGALNPEDNRFIWKPFQKSTGERVMIHWPRRSDEPEIDWVVRVQEVVD